MQDRKTVAEDVIRLLRRSDDLPLTARQMADILGISIDLVRRALIQLVRADLIMMVSEHDNRHRGRTWRVVEPPEGVG